MMGFGAIGELPLGAISDADSTADNSVTTDFYATPPENRVYIIELTAYEPGGDA